MKGSPTLEARLEDLPKPNPDSYLGLINAGVVKTCLNQICALDQQQLNNMVAAHAGGLDVADPAGAIIDWKRRTTAPARELSPTPIKVTETVDAYVLGVAFGRFLVTSALPSGEGLPTVASLNDYNSLDELQSIATEQEQGKQKLIDDYLNAARERSLHGLSRHDMHVSPDLQIALDSFCEHCKNQLRGTMVYGGGDAIRRGCIDFFSILSLLIAPEPKRRQLIRRTRGFKGLLGLL